MKLFDVYPRYDIEPVKAEGCYVFDAERNEYLDLYGGHAVISIGHSHPHYVETVSKQLHRIGFYSNSVKMSIQDRLAERLEEVSGLSNYQLFLCNSGAEANENALKLASFYTGRKKVIVFDRGFHGRTSLAVEATDSKKIQAPINHTGNFVRLPFNDIEALRNAMDDSVAAVITEGVQGIGGIYVPDASFLREIEKLCHKHNALFIADEIQSGYGRTGKFFAFEHADVTPDIITMAKGMGNGFPIGGILIKDSIDAWPGMLGTTFGGNHLACAAGLAVLDVIAEDRLIANASTVGDYLIAELKQIGKFKEVRGLGLMIGIEFEEPIKELRTSLLLEKKIFTGSASNPNTLRLLPPLSINKKQVDYFLTSLIELTK